MRGGVGKEEEVAGVLRLAAKGALDRAPRGCTLEGWAVFCSMQGGGLPATAVDVALWVVPSNKQS